MSDPLHVVTVGRFTLTITKENDRHYTGMCSGCGQVTPHKSALYPLDKWFVWHLNGFKKEHGIVDIDDIPVENTMWRIN